MGIRKAIFFAVLCAASGQQVQNMWDILNLTKSTAEIINLSTNAVPGPTYSPLAKLPVTIKFDCNDLTGPGFYADVATHCQVFHKCDENGTLTSYLCTNMTFFSPITLACDYVSNVECQKFSQYVGLSSSRLYSTAAAATNLIAMPSPAPKAPAPSPGIDKAAATAANTGTATAAV